MAEMTESKSARPSSWGLLAGLILFALMLLLVQARQQPPAARGADAPAAEFSAARSLAVLRTLVGDGSPHPVGSPADDRVRERIVAELRRLGYAPEVQEGSGCGQGLCARLRNVVARLDGTAPGKAVLLMAHYDSVPAGPGVGDDLSGVATILEVARALKSGPPPKNPVIFLLDEGEEAGLLGAELFAGRHPAAKDVGVVVNLEARGTAGPSLMFETSGDDAWMVDLFARAAPRPVTSSLYATIYDLLPNDTDLTVFKRTQVNGLNFAFVKNPNFYHTSRDTVDSLSTASLQHHGDNALAAARALAQADLAAPPKGDAVFFDVLSLGVVRWPKGWTPALAIVALVLVAVAAMRALRRSSPLDMPRRGLLFGLLGFWGTVAVALLVSVGVSLLLRGAMPYTWVDKPQAELTAFWMLGIGVALLIAGVVARRAGAAGLWSAVWIGWAILGVVVAMTAPGIAYLFVVPALVAGVVGLGLAPEGLAASLVPGLVAALLWMPILSPLYDGLGAPALVAIGLLVAVLVTSLAPLVPAAGALGRRWLPLAAFAVAVVCAGLAFASAPFSERTPQPLPIQFVQDVDSGQARWVVFGGRPLPPTLRQAGPFPQERVQAYEWGPPMRRAFVAPAPRLEVPGPQASVLDDSTAQGMRTLRLLLTSNRGAREVAVLVPSSAKLASATVDGEPLQHLPGGPPGSFQPIGSWMVGPDGVEVVLLLGETAPQDFRIYDLSEGLPTSGEALLDARPASAVPFQNGDTTMVVRKVKL